MTRRYRFGRFSPSFLVLCLLAAAPAGAVPHWIPLGPEGGTVLALAADPATPSTLYAATNGGGVWKSADGAAHWAWSSLGLGNTIVNALILDPRTPTTLYAGTNLGLAKSVDGGATWAAKTGLPAELRIVMQLAADPLRPGVIYAGSFQGLARSTDGGESWQLLSTPFQNASLLALSPRRPSTLYVFSDSTAIWKSADGGATWSAASPLPSTAAPLALYAAPDGSLFAAVAPFLSPVQPVLFVSRDGGASWSQIGRGLEGRAVHALALSPRTGTLYAGTPEGVFRSLDGGATFQPAGLSGSFLSFALAPGSRRADTVYAGARDLGVFKSGDGGRSWRTADSGLLASEIDGLALATAPRAGATVTLYAASPNGQVWRSDTAGESFAAVTPLPLPIPGTYAGALAVDPGQPSLVYAGLRGLVARSANGGLLWRRKTGGGALGPMDTRVVLVDPQDTRIVYAAGARFFPHGGGCVTWKSEDKGESWTCIPEAFDDLVLDPQSPATLYGSTGNNVRKTTDGGATWSDAGNGLAGFVNALALAPSAPATLYAATTGGVFRTVDAGASWTRAGNRGLPVGPPYSSLTEIAVEPSDARVVYAVDLFYGDSLVNPPRARVYKSTDGADSWTLLSDGLPRVDGTSRLVFDPRQPGGIFLGTAGRGTYLLVP